jgi:hypothetical protein
MTLMRPRVELTGTALRIIMPRGFRVAVSAALDPPDDASEDEKRRGGLIDAA